MAYTRLNPKTETLTITPVTGITLQDSQAVQVGNIVLLSFSAKATQSIAAASSGWVTVGTVTVIPPNEIHFPASMWHSSNYVPCECVITSIGNLNTYKPSGTSGLVSGDILYAHLAFEV